MVKITKNKLEAYRTDIHLSEKKSKLIPQKKSCYRTPIKKAFVKVSPVNSMTSFSGGYGVRAPNVLAHISGKKYVHVGSEIYEFEALAPILSYIPSVGNSDVIYAHGVDSKGNVYLFADRKVLLAGSIPSIKPNGDILGMDESVYFLHYGLRFPTVEMGKRKYDLSKPAPRKKLMSDVDSGVIDTNKSFKGKKNMKYPQVLDLITIASYKPVIVSMKAKIKVPRY